jgi:hypothetical protein
MKEWCLGLCWNSSMSGLVPSAAHVSNRRQARLEVNRVKISLGNGKLILRHTVIIGFSSHWHLVKKNFPCSVYPNSVMHIIVNTPYVFSFVLENIQNSLSELLIWILHSCTTSDKCVMKSHVLCFSALSIKQSYWRKKSSVASYLPRTH